MDAAAAEALLRRLVQPAVTPTLTDAEIDGLLADAVAVDEDGYAPSEAEWTATYGRRAVYAAAVSGREVKIAKAAPTAIDADADGLNVKRSQVIAHLEKQKLALMRRAIGAAGARADWTATSTSDVVTNWNDPDA